MKKLLFFSNAVFLMQFSASRNNLYVSYVGRQTTSPMAWCQTEQIKSF